MAKQKPRTPTPPRQVQAPKTRTGDDLGRSHRNALYLVAGAGVVALVAVVIFVAVGSGSGKSGTSAPAGLTSLMKTAGCTYKTVAAYVPKGQALHVASLTKKLPWNTDPPSNGQHYPAWAIWDFYTQAVNPRMVVHNEEHGGVILWWGPKVSQSTVSALHNFYLEQTTGVLGAPYANLGSKVAITAWTGDTARYGSNGYYGDGHIATCPRFDAATKKAFTAFRDAYRGKGPEGVPLSADKQGLGPNSP